ncbi:hypothetical protein F444_08974 [Phytophthora nicotianae P1976]|uniref:Uncharacterized protein n=1 Tax=Phytophthora nicotianae P1976 TaxID=1317066 RepID=A0A081A955_PHYNI|nr:hypothetical protein F444_08974 [Phytophthora nicotianae P1976]
MNRLLSDLQLSDSDSVFVALRRSNSESNVRWKRGSSERLSLPGVSSKLTSN